MNKIIYSIIGGGWRAEFYLRIAKLIPDRFTVACICVRNENRAIELSKKFNVKIVKTIDELKAVPCDFIVNCTNKNDISDISFELAKEGYAVLSETPACTGKEHADALLRKYRKEYRIQVAEQFRLKPVYQATRAIIDSGIIGEPRYINISVAHEYHAMSLMRFFLNTAASPVKISDTSFVLPILHTNYRNGEVPDKRVENSVHTLKVFSFNEKTAIYDYETEQYFSPIRTDRLLIRGDRGEIENDTVRYFNDNNEFIESKIIQHKSGNLDGLFNAKISFENKIIYEPQFGDARINDEETAIADVLTKMKEYTISGTEFYSFEDAIKDVIYFI